MSDSGFNEIDALLAEAQKIADRIATADPFTDSRLDRYPRRQFEHLRSHIRTGRYNAQELINHG
ncbi:hypothetical protein OS122_02720 [Mycolicibacterium mucogenicum]|uniref:hypothetical protein n=1 Tax=Mycolicibacterium mucogenicum TaxID=56689 RepID=UPI00226A7D1A|nr:hypothetical protein [Mycolicibacterium mucogenicum]MCX8559812.1 hypothetical protein [Mycolicibacterium mucogenicum]